MRFAISMIWYDRARFIPAVLAVAMSGVLISLQLGMLLGVVTVASAVVDHSRAEIWLAYPGTRSVDMGMPIPLDWRATLAMQPEVVRTEEALIAYMPWKQPGVGVEMCALVGSHLDAEALGAIIELTPELRARLAEPGTVVLDAGDCALVGIYQPGETFELASHRIKVVGFVRGLKGLLAVYMFCSLETARLVLSAAGLQPNQTNYVVARCRRPGDARRVVERLRGDRNYTIFTAAEFSFQTRKQWLTRSNGGLTFLYAALLGLLVGAVVTTQTMSAAIAAALREWAILEAVGLPGWCMRRLVIAQSFIVGVLGVVVALPSAYILSWFLSWLGTSVLLPAWLASGSAGVVLLVALLSGLLSFRALRLAEPAILLH
jgi:putative ABC transport system permease protein